MNRLAWAILLTAAVMPLAALPLHAQDAEVPRTRTLPGIENPAFPYAEPEQVGLSTEELARLDDEITSWVANGDLVGAELLIIKDGWAVFHEAYGWADREERRPMERNTIFSIMSMSKSFTATAVLMLAGAGDLSLDDPVSRYLPAFPDDETTIHHLLSQTSGFDVTEEIIPVSPVGFESLGAWVEVLMQDERAAPLGTFRYTDYNYNFLGQIVEEVSGLPIETFTEERILEPLGLEATFTAFSPDSSWADRVSSRYRWMEDARGHRRYWTRYDEQPWPFYPASHGLYATAMDYAVFMATWMNKGAWRGTRLLSEDTVSEALQIHGVVDAREGYGYGWRVGHGLAGAGTPSRFGHGGIHGTWAMAFPQSNAMAIFLTQSRDGGGGPNSALLTSLSLLGGLDALGPYMVEANEAAIEPVTLTQEARRRYVGSYRGRAPADTAEVVGRVWEEDGHLSLRLGELVREADLVFHLVPLGDDRFAHGRYVDGRLEAVEEGLIEQFVVDAGAVTGFEQSVDGHLSLSMLRADPEALRIEIEAERSRVAIDDLIARVVEAEGRERAREIHRAILEARPDSVILAESLLNNLGYRLLQADQADEAIAVFEMNVEAYPEEPNPYDSLGDAYRAAGRLEEARRSYARAVELGEQRGHESLNSYRRNLQRITELLEGQ